MKLLRRIVLLLSFICFYLMKLVQGSIQVAHAVLWSRQSLKPALLAVPLHAKSDIEILVLSNLLSMTPGTLSVDVAADRSTLFVHCILVNDPEALVREIKQNFERRVLEVLR